jgi:hypothetical protein
VRESSSGCVAMDSLVECVVLSRLGAVWGFAVIEGE